MTRYAMRRCPVCGKSFEPATESEVTCAPCTAQRVGLNQEALITDPARLVEVTEGHDWPEVSPAKLAWPWCEKKGRNHA